MPDSIVKFSFDRLYALYSLSSYLREQAITGEFTFVAIDEHKKPAAIV